MGGDNLSKLPEGWIKVLLSDVAEWGSGGTPSRANPAHFGGDILWVKTGELGQGLIQDTEEKITELGLQNSSAKVFPKGSIVIAMYGATIGKVAILGIDAATNQACAVGIPKQGIINAKYLFHYLASQKDAFIEAGKGGAQPNISQKVIKDWTIPLASFDEQERIANKLDSILARVDACRARLNRIPSILQNFRKAVLEAAVSGELTEDWRAKMNLSMDSWQNKLGGEVFPFVTSGSRGWAAYYAATGALFLRVGNLNHNTIDLDLSKIQYVNPPAGAEGKRTRVEAGDILISITADVGRVAFVREDMGEAYINQHLCLLRQTGDFLGAYLAYFLTSPSGGLGQLTKMERGVTKAGLTLTDIRSIRLLIPELDEQVEIVRRVESLLSYANRIENRYQNALTQVEQVTPAILDKAFRGELVLPNPNDEPTSVLLDRIREERILQSKKPKIFVERRQKTMTKITDELVQGVIRQLPKDKFTFDELSEKVSGEYDLLRDILFDLLDKNYIRQVFDQEAQKICFTRIYK